jgi:hypothetical protein
LSISSFARVFCARDRVADGHVDDDAILEALHRAVGPDALGERAIAVQQAPGGTISIADGVIEWGDGFLWPRVIER